jgi:arsenate reductase
MTVTIYHNPACSTSRNVLAMIRRSGEEPEVIEYLKTPPSREKLKALIAAMGVSPRDILRRKGTPYDELGLDDPKWTEELIGFMIEHPILINRPIVETPNGDEALPAAGNRARHPAQSGYRSARQIGQQGRRARFAPANDR